MCDRTLKTDAHSSTLVSLLLPVYFAHHGFDIDWSRSSGCLGLFHLLLFPEDDGIDARASVLSILFQLGRTRVETETRGTQDDCKTFSSREVQHCYKGLSVGSDKQTDVINS